MDNDDLNVTASNVGPSATLQLLDDLAKGAAAMRDKDGKAVMFKMPMLCGRCGEQGVTWVDAFMGHPSVAEFICVAGKCSFSAKRTVPA